MGFLWVIVRETGYTFAVMSSHTASMNTPSGITPAPGLLHGDLTSAIIGAFFSVHSRLGVGFLEHVYGNALALLLTRTGLRVQREVPFDVVFDHEFVGHYRADIVVESKVIVEVKSVTSIAPVHVAQLINYLKASGIQLGLLLNFGESARFRRVVWTKHAPRNSL
jgi:GxxExxY protein